MNSLSILIDTNVLIDYLIKRSGFFEDASKVFSLLQNNQIKGFVASYSLPTFWYVARHSLDDSTKRKLLLSVFDILELTNLDKEVFLSALNRTDFKDFEDCLQDECAAKANIDYIVTRNVKDFETSRIPALTPEEFVKRVG